MGRRGTRRRNRSWVALAANLLSQTRGSMFSDAAYERAGRRSAPCTDLNSGGKVPPVWVPPASAERLAGLTVRSRPQLTARAHVSLRSNVLLFVPLRSSTDSWSCFQHLSIIFQVTGSAAHDLSDPDSITSQSARR